MELLSALLAVLALLALGSGPGDCLQVILGDPVSFPLPEECAPDSPADIRLIGASGTRPVAARAGGVWTPEPRYEGRVSPRSSWFTLSRSALTDAGLYELSCAGQQAETHLNVLVGFHASVTEGGPLRLDCHYSTEGGRVDSVRWEKDGRVVLERSLSSTETAGSEPRASFPPGGERDGDWSLLMDAARPQDAGDYFCSARYKGAREAWGQPAAVRLTVIHEPDQTTAPPLLTTTQVVTEEQTGACWGVVAITACVVFVFVAPSFLLLGWCLKSRSCRCGPYAAVDANGDPQHASGDPQHANGGPQHTNGGLQHAKGDPQHANGGLQHANGGPQHTNGGLQHTNGGPQHTNGDPQHTSGDPQHANGDPQHTNGGLQHTNGGPQHANRDPQHANRDVQHANRDPQHANEDPQHANGGLQHANRAPQHSNGGLQHANRAPQHANRAPQHANRAPQHANRDPQHANGPNGGEVRIDFPLICFRK